MSVGSTNKGLWEAEGTEKKRQKKKSHKGKGGGGIEGPNRGVYEKGFFALGARNDGNCSSIETRTAPDGRFFFGEGGRQSCGTLPAVLNAGGAYGSSSSKSRGTARGQHVAARITQQTNGEELGMDKYILYIYI